MSGETLQTMERERERTVHAHKTTLSAGARECVRACVRECFRVFVLRWIWVGTLDDGRLLTWLLYRWRLPLCLPCSLLRSFRHASLTSSIGGAHKHTFFLSFSNASSTPERAPGILHHLSLPSALVVLLASHSFQSNEVSHRDSPFRRFFPSVSGGGGEVANGRRRRAAAAAMAERISLSWRREEREKKSG